jgi:amidase
MNMRRNDQQTKYAEMWNKTGIDFILAPANPASATSHDETRWDGYTGVWNALDHTAITFPVTNVRASDTYENFPRLSEKPLGLKDEYYIAAYKEGTKKYVNAPVALQVIGRRHTEEKMLKVVEIVENLLKGSV